MYSVGLRIALGKPVLPIEKKTLLSSCPVSCIDLTFKNEAVSLSLLSFSSAAIAPYRVIVFRNTIETMDTSITPKYN